MEPSPSWFLSLGWWALSKTAVPLFLIIMGALLLEKQDTPQKSVSRFFRIAVILLVVSVLYYIYFHRESQPFFTLAGFLKTFILYKTNTAIWYLYLYLALLCLLPILQKLASVLDRKTILWLLFLSFFIQAGVSFCAAVGYPNVFGCAYLTYILPHPFIGYLLSGYYIERHMKLTHRKAVLAAAAIPICIGLMLLAAFLIYQRQNGQGTAYCEIPCGIMYPLMIAASLCTYIAVKYLFSIVSIGPAAQRIITRLGSLTFGIYLLGDLSIDLLRPVYEVFCLFLHPLAANLLWELLLFTVCAAAATLLKRTPVLKKWL